MSQVPATPKPVNDIIVKVNGPDGVFEAALPNAQDLMKFDPEKYSMAAEDAEVAEVSAAEEAPAPVEPKTAPVVEPVKEPAPAAEPAKTEAPKKTAPKAPAAKKSASKEA